VRCQESSTRWCFDRPGMDRCWLHGHPRTELPVRRDQDLPSIQRERRHDSTTGRTAIFGRVTNKRKSLPLDLCGPGRRLFASPPLDTQSTAPALAVSSCGLVHCLGHRSTASATSILSLGGNFAGLCGGWCVR
jgi:hypothetical protein